MKCPNCKKNFHRVEALPLMQSEEKLLGSTYRKTLITLTRPEEPFLCPHCLAMIQTNDRFRKLNICRYLPALPLMFLAPFLPLGIIFTVTVATGQADSPLGTSLGLGVAAVFLIPMFICTSISIVASILLRHTNRWTVVWVARKCDNCSTAVELEDAEFCPKCGAELPARSLRIVIGGDKIGSRKLGHKALKSPPVGTCLVCDLEMKINDVLADCPHCGNTFHRDHLVSWVHMKKHCPACGEHLAETEIITVPNEESTREDRVGGAF